MKSFSSLGSCEPLRVNFWARAFFADLPLDALLAGGRHRVAGHAVVPGLDLFQRREPVHIALLDVGALERVDLAEAVGVLDDRDLRQCASERVPGGDEAGAVLLEYGGDDLLFVDLVLGVGRVVGGEVGQGVQAALVALSELGIEAGLLVGLGEELDALGAPERQDGLGRDHRGLVTALDGGEDPHLEAPVAVDGGVRLVPGLLQDALGVLRRGSWHLLGVVQGRIVAVDEEGELVDECGVGQLLLTTQQGEGQLCPK